MRPILLAVICGVILLLQGPAQAGWKEANVALQAGRPAEALPHLRPLAEAGGSAAQYMMGYLLSGATSIQRNLMESFKWYTIAYAQGRTDAGPAREIIGKKLGPFKAAEAQRQAQVWLNEHGGDTSKLDAEDDAQKAEDADKDVPVPRDKPDKPS